MKTKEVQWSKTCANPNAKQSIRLELNEILHMNVFKHPQRENASLLVFSAKDGEGVKQLFVL